MNKSLLNKLQVTRPFNEKKDCRFISNVFSFYIQLIHSNTYRNISSENPLNLLNLKKKDQEIKNILRKCPN